jgi:EAL domain-containing protein (putative c-di-GMP-specific phosphodiesterase class I)
VVSWRADPNRLKKRPAAPQKVSSKAPAKAVSKAPAREVASEAAAREVPSKAPVQEVAPKSRAPELDLDGAPILMFQPAVDLATGCLLGFEALLRWYDSSGRYIPPNTLIAEAEAKGQMKALNDWVLSEACTQAARWPSLLQVAVNCTVFQLRRGEVARSALTALERSGLKPDRLSLEVTETSVTDDEAASDLHAITRLGIQLSLDDIASDGSVRENLKDRVANTIKIDASLVAGLADPDGQSRVIVESIVKLCFSLGISTVAEAVETAEQVAILREVGAGAAQGFFFSRPLAADDAYKLAAMNPLPHFCLTDPDWAENSPNLTSKPGQGIRRTDRSRSE